MGTSVTLAFTRPRQLDTYTSPVTALSNDGLNRAGSILLPENGRLKPYGFGLEPVDAAELFDRFAATYNSSDEAARCSFVRVVLWSDHENDRRRFTYGPSVRRLDVAMAGAVPKFILICQPQNRESSARIEYDKAAPASALLAVDRAMIMVVGREPGFFGRRRVHEIDVECAIVDINGQITLSA
jgi:hypothetical protein